MNAIIDNFWLILALFSALGILYMFGLVAETMRRNRCTRRHCIKRVPERRTHMHNYRSVTW